MQGFCVDTVPISRGMPDTAHRWSNILVASSNNVFRPKIWSITFLSEFGSATVAFPLSPTSAGRIFCTSNLKTSKQLSEGLFINRIMFAHVSVAGLLITRYDRSDFQLFRGRKLATFSDGLISKDCR